MLISRIIIIIFVLRVEILYVTTLTNDGYNIDSHRNIIVIFFYAISLIHFYFSIMTQCILVPHQRIQVIIFQSGFKYTYSSETRFRRATDIFYRNLLVYSIFVVQLEF